METILGKEFPKKVIPFIEAAKRSIRIVVFDWRWYPNDPGNPVQLFNQAIVRAVRRGVKVEAIANCDDIVARLVSVGCEARKLITPKLIHAKLMLIDDALAIVGSHNYTQNAFTMNHEFSVILDCSSNPAPFNRFFDSLLSAYG